MNRMLFVILLVTLAALTGCDKFGDKDNKPADFQAAAPAATGDSATHEAYSLVIRENGRETVNISTSDAQTFDRAIAAKVCSNCSEPAAKPATARPKARGHAVPAKKPCPEPDSRPPQGEEPSKRVTRSIVGAGQLYCCGPHHDAGQEVCFDSRDERDEHVRREHGPGGSAPPPSGGSGQLYCCGPHHDAGQEVCFDSRDERDEHVRREHGGHRRR